MSQPTATAAANEERFAAGFAAFGVAASFALLGSALLDKSSLGTVGPVAIAVVVAAVFHRTILRWRSLVAAILLVILFIPIKHYRLPVELPIALEPYRVLVGLVALGWVAAALVDPRVRIRRSGLFEGPLAVFGLAILISQLVNLGRVEAVAPRVVKEMLFLASYVIVFYLVASVLERRRDIAFILQTLVIAGAVVAVFALVESRTGLNVFRQLERVMPILHEAGDGGQLSRSGRIRAVASAQHTIALGAMLTLLVPIAFAFAVSRRKLRWWLVLAILVLGALASVSRTAVVMLVAVVLVLLWLRPQQTRRLWLALIPAVVLVHFAIPGTLGALKKSFTTEQLITKSQDSPVGSGRLATLGPALREEFVPNPLFGEGFATRVTVPEPNIDTNAYILDNQWLGILLETGILGAMGLLWLFMRSIRVMGKTGKEDDSEVGWLLCGVTAAIAAYGVAMFTFDIFSFVQVTFLLFILLGIGCALYRISKFPTHQAPDRLGAAA